MPRASCVITIPIEVLVDFHYDIEPADPEVGIRSPSPGEISDETYCFNANGNIGDVIRDAMKHLDLDDCPEIQKWKEEWRPGDDRSDEPDTRPED